MSLLNDVTSPVCRLISPVTAEKHLPTVVSPLPDAELCDVVALAHKALSASKQAALLAEDSETAAPPTRFASLPLFLSISPNHVKNI